MSNFVWPTLRSDTFTNICITFKRDADINRHVYFTQRKLCWCNGMIESKGSFGGIQWFFVGKTKTKHYLILPDRSEKVRPDLLCWIAEKMWTKIDITFEEDISSSLNRNILRMKPGLKIQVDVPKTQLLGGGHPLLRSWMKEDWAQMNWPSNPNLCEQRHYMKWLSQIIQMSLGSRRKYPSCLT